MDMNRRQLLAAATSYLLIRGLVASNAIAGGPPVDLHAWLLQLRERCRDLKRLQLAPQQWQQEVEVLYRRVSLDLLLRAAAPARLITALVQRPETASGLQIAFPELEGVSGCETAVFGFPEGTAIPPHGHRNLVAAHVVLQGELRIRQYDRVLDLPGASLLRPRADAVARVGDVSSVSDGACNVHWLEATRGPAITFDVMVAGVDPSGPPALVAEFFDIANADARRDLLRAPSLSEATAAGRYGRVAR